MKQTVRHTSQITSLLRDVCVCEGRTKRTLRKAVTQASQHPPNPGSLLQDAAHARYSRQVVPVKSENTMGRFGVTSANAQNPKSSDSLHTADHVALIKHQARVISVMKRGTALL